MFKQEFGDRFSGYVAEGDTITCEVNGFTCTARVYRDDDNEGPPDKRQDGFWPSLDANDPGYIGPKTKGQLKAALRRASGVMNAWKRGEWYYCGVAVTVSRAGVELIGEFDHALWGVDCNYPSRGRLNRYLREVANELLPDALADANAKLDALLEGLK